MTEYGSDTNQNDCTSDDGNDRIKFEEDEEYVVKLRGLPWSTTTDEVFKFFKGCNIKDGMAGIHMISSKEGRASGEAFVEFIDSDNLQLALEHDREHIGNRYIEVFKVNRAEMEYVLRKCKQVNYMFKRDGCVRLRGLPFGCSKEEISDFFSGFEIIPNGITLLKDFSGRSSGEAYVQFVNKDLAEGALLKHREKIGHRYIEIFRSSLAELNDVLGHPDQRVGVNNSCDLHDNSGCGFRPGPYDRSVRFSGGNSGINGNGRLQRNMRNFKGNFNIRGSGGFGGRNNWSNPGNDYGNGNAHDFRNRNMSWTPSQNSRGDARGQIRGGGGNNFMGDPKHGSHYVHMRGLPFKATQMDIADFFKPLNPVNIRLLKDHTGRASGEADVEFGCHEDAIRAMTFDKGNMQHRYIELFLNSNTPGSFNDGRNFDGNGESFNDNRNDSGFAYGVGGRR